MLAIVYIFTIIYAFVRRKRKGMWLWCAALMTIMMLTASYYADLNNYSRYFDSVAGGYRLPGFEATPEAWRWLCLGFANLGFSYRGMQAVLIFFSLYLIHCTLKDESVNENVFWGLYLIFPLPYQCVQTRFFLGVSIIWYGFSFLIKKEKKGIIIFLICLMSAILIHRGCGMFISLFLVLLVHKKSVKKATIITLIGAATLYMMIGYVPNLASRFINKSTLIRYFTHSSTKTSFVYFVEVVLLWIAFIVVSIITENNKGCNSLRIWTIRKDRYRSIFDKTGYITGLIVLGITLPLMMFDSNFSRCALLSTVFSYYSISSYHSESKKSYLGLLCCYVFLSFIGMLILIPYDGIMKQLFTIDGIYSPFR